MDYSKGKWGVSEEDFGYSVRCVKSIINGFDEDDDVEIAEINGYLDNEGEAIANAHLIAASPRMANLLERLVNDGWNASISEEAEALLQTLYTR